MELKQRKKINNIPKFNNGIDSKVGFGQQYQANDLASMIGGNAAAGAAVGTAIVPGIGSLIGGAAGAIVGLFGGLFGGKKAREKQRRKIFNAQQNANLINQANQSSAATEGLTQQYYLNNGNTYDDVLYANRGKDLIKPRYVKRK